MQASAPANWQSIAARIARHCGASGLDLVQPFAVADYNAQVTDVGLRLSDLGRRRALGLIVANTSRLWPAFRAALELDAELVRAPEPLDAFITTVLERAVGELGVLALVRYAHVLEPTPLPIQRIAHFAGLAWLSPSHLSVHAEHGPWIALRAVIVIDVDGPNAASPEPLDTCGACSKPCMPALEHALSETVSRRDAGSISKNWRAWLAVRDACPVGRASRYGEEQLEYHYTKARRLLVVGGRT